jgi:hypothetical protein
MHFHLFSNVESSSAHQPHQPLKHHALQLMHAWVADQQLLQQGT